MSPPAAPLVLTVALDGQTFVRLDELRRRHYPPERNRVPAHLTLFHALPGEDLTVISRELSAICAAHRPFPLLATGWKSLGRGTALAFSSPELVALRQRLAREWRNVLTAQDSARIAPHVTVQNKVSPREADVLRRDLQARFQPFEARAEGVLLWRYLGGPWEPVRHFAFRA